MQSTAVVPMCHAVSRIRNKVQLDGINDEQIIVYLQLHNANWRLFSIFVNRRPKLVFITLHMARSTSHSETTKSCETQDCLYYYSSSHSCQMHLKITKIQWQACMLPQGHRDFRQYGVLLSDAHISHMCGRECSWEPPSEDFSSRLLKHSTRMQPLWDTDRIFSDTRPNVSHGLTILDIWL